MLRILLLALVTIAHSFHIPSFHTKRIKATRYDVVDLRDKIARLPTSPKTQMYLSSLLLKKYLQFDLICENQVGSLCADVHDTLKAIEVILLNAIQIHEPIKVLVEVISMCQSIGNCEGTTLAGAVPASYWTFENHTKIDPQYRYPQALAKQLVRDVNVEWAEYDICVMVNSDGRDPVNNPGETSRFWFARHQEPISAHEIDLRAVLLHELIHGLGFISGWGHTDDHTLKDALFPLLPFWKFISRNHSTQEKIIETDYSLNKTIQPDIFDKFIYIANGTEALHHFFRELASIRSQLFSKAVDEAEFQQLLVQHPVFLKAKQVYEYATTRGGLEFRSPAPSNETLEKYEKSGRKIPNTELRMILDTSFLPYRNGSSISHLDGTAYEYSSDFLMTPKVRPGESLETLTQDAEEPISSSLVRILETIGYDINFENSSSWRKSYFDRTFLNRFTEKQLLCMLLFVLLPFGACFFVFCLRKR